MTRYRSAQAVAGVAALSFVVVAGLHLSSYRRVVQQAQQGISGLAPLVATLWLAFGAGMLVLGAIVSLAALGRIKRERWILALAGCFPLITVLLQLRMLGFTPATAHLAVVAAVSFAAAILFPGAS